MGIRWKYEIWKMSWSIHDEVHLCNAASGSDPWLLWSILLCRFSSARGTASSVLAPPRIRSSRRGPTSSSRRTSSCWPSTSKRPNCRSSFPIRLSIRFAASWTLFDLILRTSMWTIIAKCKLWDPNNPFIIQSNVALAPIRGFQVRTQLSQLKSECSSLQCHGPSVSGDPLVLSDSSGLYCSRKYWMGSKTIKTSSTVHCLSSARAIINLSDIKFPKIIPRFILEKDFWSTENNTTSVLGRPPSIFDLKLRVIYVSAIGVSSPNLHPVALGADVQERGNVVEDDRHLLKDLAKLE